MNSIAAATLRNAVGMLGMTWRVQVQGGEHLARLRRARQPFIFALWHRDLLPLLWHHRGQGTTLVVSRHQDGARLARAARGWGYHVIHGSSTRGGAQALREMLRALAAGHEVALTPDGPRGPARSPKAGIVLAAQKAGVPVLPVAATARPVVSLGSWDRFQVPTPFARVHIVYHEPLVFAPGSSARRDGLRTLQVHLDEAARMATC